MKLDLRDYPGQDKIDCGTLKTFEIAMDPFPDRRMRTIRVWLPESYDGRRRVPVLYLHDGQNLFGGLDDRPKWFVEREMKKVPDEARPIVVAIDTAPTRGEELCPAWPLTGWFGKMLRGGAKGDLYCAFVTDVLKPLIDENFLTLPDREHTGVGGASMGGVQSFYMHLARPDVFGRSLDFSVALGVTDLDFILDWYRRRAEAVKNDRFYFYNGGQQVDQGNIRPQLALYEAMEAEGMDYRHVCLVLDSREPHYETAWQKFFADGVRYLFCEDNSVAFPPAR